MELDRLEQAANAHEQAHVSVALFTVVSTSILTGERYPGAISKTNLDT